MKTSPGSSLHNTEVSNISNSNATCSSNQQSQSSGLVSMLSPRNIMKFFTKNGDDIRPTSPSHFSPRFLSSFKGEQISRQFQTYFKSISTEMQKYHTNQAKAKHKQTINHKEKQRQEIEEEVKLSKIGQQYFQEWAHETDLEEEPQSSKSLDPLPEKIHTTHRSSKLQSLLCLADEGRKKSKQKRRVLEQKQIELEGYLDEIQLFIYNKTRKYPDRYLHYLVCLSDSDIQVNGLLEKVKLLRNSITSTIVELNSRYLKIKRMETKRRALAQTIQLMSAMRDIHSLKQQSQNFKSFKQSQQLPVSGISNSSRAPQISSRQVMKMIAHHPKLGSLYLLQAVTSTLQNVEELGKTIRSQRFSYSCEMLSKHLHKSLQQIYSRQQWLRNQLPKDAIMLHKMKPQLQALADGDHEDGNLSRSYMNISILDQSYCVGTTSGEGRKQFGANRQGEAWVSEVDREWVGYCREYEVRGRVMEEEDQELCEIFERAVLKFCHAFYRDLQDYITYIYSKKFGEPPAVPFPQKVWYIQPKLYNKIGTVYFEALSTIFKYGLIFKNLPSICYKLLEAMQKKIQQFMGLKGLTQYNLVVDRVLDYQDVQQVLGLFDFWAQFVDGVGDGSQGPDGFEDRLAEFQECLIKSKHKIAEEFLNNLHKFALIQDLKNVIEQDSFTDISIPVSSFWILDMIINWGQSTPENNNNKAQEIDESFCYGPCILTENLEAKKKIVFSIFRCIDKKLVIEGREYRMCNSLLLLSAYVQVYLRAKMQWVELTANIDQRICELIGFYIWYCKKIIMSNQNHHHMEHHQTNSKHTNQNKVTVAPSKKNIGSLSMLINNCDLLMKFIDILEIASKPKKVEKAVADLKAIKDQAFKEISMLILLEIERQISCLYESKLKSRKQIPTKESVKIIQVLNQSKLQLSKFFDESTIKKALESGFKMVSKNYFGYLSNMQARGKSELRWFIPQLKQTISYIFQEEIWTMQKQLKY